MYFKVNPCIRTRAGRGGWLIQTTHAKDGLGLVTYSMVGDLVTYRANRRLNFHKGATGIVLRGRVRKSSRPLGKNRGEADVPLVR